MKVVIAGQKSFGAAVLNRLAGEVDIVGVHAPMVAQQDKLNARAAELKIPSLFQLTPGTMYDVDLLINAHGHERIPRRVREATTYGAIGYHPSLLPRHRGRSAVEWTIEMRDPIAGGTVYRLDDGLDEGPLLATAWCHVDPAWDASALWRERLFPMGVELIYQVVGVIARESGITWGREQDEDVATYEPVWGTDAAEEVREFKRRIGMRRLMEIEKNEEIHPLDPRVP